MHVDVQWRHFLLEEDPDNFVVPFVRSPVERRVLSHFLSVFRFHERIVDLLAVEADLHSLVGFSRGLILVLVQIGTASARLNEHADYLLIAVAGRPQQRVPAFFLDGGRCVFAKEEASLFYVVLLACFQKAVVELLLSDFLFLFFLAFFFVFEHFVLDLGLLGCLHKLFKII